MITSKNMPISNDHEQNEVLQKEIDRLKELKNANPESYQQELKKIKKNLEDFSVLLNLVDEKIAETVEPNLNQR